MKKLLTAYILMLLVCFGLSSSAAAAVQYGQDDWGTTLDANQSITCIAYFVWGSTEFYDVPTQVPPGVYTSPSYDNGGRWDDIGWEATLSADHKIAYMYGPQTTNTTDVNDLGWFVYTLSYLWNDADPNFDPDWPVYIDMALYNGPAGSAPIDVHGWRGTPGVPISWEYRETPYATDQPWYTDDFFYNPVPEPMTILLLGLGSTVFLAKRRTALRRFT